MKRLFTTIITITTAIVLAMPSQAAALRPALLAGLQRPEQTKRAGLRPMAVKTSYKGGLFAFLRRSDGNRSLSDALCAELINFYEMKSPLGNPVQWHLRVKKAADFLMKKCGTRRKAKKVLLRLESLYEERTKDLRGAWQRKLFLESVKAELICRGVWREKKLSAFLNRPEDYLANITNHTLPFQYRGLKFSCQWPVDLSCGYIHHFHRQDYEFESDPLRYKYHNGIDIRTQPGAVVKNIMRGNVFAIKRTPWGYSKGYGGVAVYVYSPERKMVWIYGHLDVSSLSEKIQKALKGAARYDNYLDFNYAEGMSVELDEGEYIGKIAKWDPSLNFYGVFGIEAYRHFSYRLFGLLFSHLHLSAFINVDRKPYKIADLTAHLDEIDPLLLLKNLYPIDEVIMAKGEFLLKDAQEAHRYFNYFIEQARPIFNEMRKGSYASSNLRNITKMADDIISTARELYACLGELIEDIETAEKNKKPLSENDKWKYCYVISEGIRGLGYFLNEIQTGTAWCDVSDSRKKFLCKLFLKALDALKTLAEGINVNLNADRDGNFPGILDVCKTKLELNKYSDLINSLLTPEGSKHYHTMTMEGRISWLHGAMNVNANIYIRQRDTRSDCYELHVFPVFSSEEFMACDGILKSTKGNYPGVLPGSIGRMLLYIAVVDGKPALLIKEIQTTEGFRRLPQHIIDRYDVQWVLLAKEFVVSLAKAVGIEKVYVMTGSSLRQTYGQIHINHQRNVYKKPFAQWAKSRLHTIFSDGSLRATRLYEFSTEASFGLPSYQDYGPQLTGFSDFYPAVISQQQQITKDKTVYVTVDFDKPVKTGNLKLVLYYGDKRSTNRWQDIEGELINDYGKSYRFKFRLPKGIEGKEYTFKVSYDNGASWGWLGWNIKVEKASRSLGSDPAYVNYKITAVIAQAALRPMAAIYSKAEWEFYEQATKKGAETRNIYRAENFERAFQAFLEARNLIEDPQARRRIRMKPSEIYEFTRAFEIYGDEPNAPQFIKGLMLSSLERMKIGRRPNKAEQEMIQEAVEIVSNFCRKHGMERFLERIAGYPDDVSFYDPEQLKVLLPGNDRFTHRVFIPVSRPKNEIIKMLAHETFHYIAGGFPSLFINWLNEGMTEYLTIMACAKYYGEDFYNNKDETTATVPALIDISLGEYAKHGKASMFLYRKMIKEEEEKRCGAYLYFPEVSLVEYIINQVLPKEGMRMEDLLKVYMEGGMPFLVNLFGDATIEKLESIGTEITAKRRYSRSLFSVLSDFQSLLALGKFYLHIRIPRSFTAERCASKGEFTALAKFQASALRPMAVKIVTADINYQQNQRCRINFWQK